ncbi:MULTISPECIES: SRPBCC family protein [unclassified Knoellia]|uniref:SRPBCC family protein n=1 Tax=Knoellia altitudinis TaxID=3404795 RepID=UPI0036099978
MKLSPPPLTLGLDVAAAPETVWDLLVHVDQWPRWGPTVRRAQVDGSGGRIGPGATGTVWTPVGPGLPFRIDAWEETGPLRQWSWHVAGLPATGHSVRAREGGCRVEMTAPWWATAYAPVLWLGLRRVRDLAQARSAGGDTTD